MECLKYLLNGFVLSPLTQFYLFDRGMPRVSLRWLVCGFLAGPPYHTESKTGLVVSNKDIESGTMDETKSQKIESLKEENLRLRQQMMEMYRAWASGLPPP
ncbi:hypothetical protein FXO37_11501 [Capsicum annuum]|nr:hypothetical protein FXO37_11501 [Capsicum annuum]